MPNVASKLDAVEVRNLKAGLRRGSDSEPSELNGGELVENAIGSMPVKEAAGHMGISDSLLCRGLQNKDHLSFQRVLKLPTSVVERIAWQMLERCGYELEPLWRVRRRA